MFSDILLSLSNTNLPILHFLPFRICFILKDLSTKKSSIVSPIQKFSWREKSGKYKIPSRRKSQIRYVRSHGKNTIGSSTKRRTDLVKVWDWRSRLEDPKKHRRRRITPSSPSHRPLEPKTVHGVLSRAAQADREHPTTSCAPALRLNEWFPRGVATLRLHSAPITPTGVARFIVSCSLLLNIAQLCLQRWPNCPDPACVIVSSPEECWNAVGTARGRSRGTSRRRCVVWDWENCWGGGKIWERKSVIVVGVRKCFRILSCHFE